MKSTAIQWSAATSEPDVSLANFLTAHTDYLGVEPTEINGIGELARHIVQSFKGRDELAQEKIIAFGIAEGLICESRQRHVRVIFLTAIKERCVTTLRTVLL